jgi:predicted nucleic acid-binding protein
MEVIAPNKRIAEKTAFLQLSLRQEGNEIPAFDALIAATAIEINAAVLSKDKHFRKVNNLHVVGW